VAVGGGGPGGECALQMGGGHKFTDLVQGAFGEPVPLVGEGVATSGHLVAFVGHLVPVVGDRVPVSGRRIADIRGVVAQGGGGVVLVLEVRPGH